MFYRHLEGKHLRSDSPLRCCLIKKLNIHKISLPARKQSRYLWPSVTEMWCQLSASCAAQCTCYHWLSGNSVSQFSLLCVSNQRRSFNPRSERLSCLTDPYNNIPDTRAVSLCWRVRRWVLLQLSTPSQSAIHMPSDSPSNQPLVQEAEIEAVGLPCCRVCQRTDQFKD